MKKVFTVIIFISSTTLFGQGWRKIDQSWLNVKYQIPSEWSLDGFGSDFGYWDEGGSSVCDCAGTINLNDENKMGMVIYPTTNTTDSVRRENVWDYHFVSTGKKETLTSKKIIFQKEVSKWDLTQGSDEYMGMLDDVVWKLTAKTNNFGLIIYIWGDPQEFKNYESKLLKILDTMAMPKK